MPAKRGRIIRMDNSKNMVDIAVLKTDLDWIKAKLNAVEKKIDSVQLCAQGHDDRLVKLEEWKGIHDKNLDDSVKKKELSNTKLIILISGSSIVTTVTLWILEHIIFHF